MYIVKNIIDNSPFYVIDNFYEDPHSIVSFLKSQPSSLHKWTPDQHVDSYNNVYFEDRRHVIESDTILHVYKFLSTLCGQRYLNQSIITNLIRFNNKTFNDYKNNYWWPHLDNGYNGLIYLNEHDEECGTNLYKNLDPQNKPCPTPEHLYPWQPKSNFKLVKSLKPKFNRLVLFDGNHFWHGMNICNDDYFGQHYRMNQVLFFHSIVAENALC